MDKRRTRGKGGRNYEAFRGKFYKHGESIEPIAFERFADPSRNFLRQTSKGHQASRMPASASPPPPPHSPPPSLRVPASFHGFARECLPSRPKSKGDEGLVRGVGRLTRQVGVKLRG